METFLGRYKNVLVLVVVLLAQIVGLAVQVKRPATGAPEAAQIRLIRYWVVSLVAPPESFLHGMGSGVRRVWSNYIYLRGIRQQNRDLKAEVDRLRLEQAGLSEDARQGQRLQQLLSFKEHYVYKTQPAQVIGTSGSDLSHVLDLNKGSDDGIRVDMPVITPDGIVGKIREVFPHSSRLLLISDQTSGAGVLLETLRIRGILRGNSLGKPQIINIMPDERIKAGDRVLTSGGDAVFPRGLPVGIVERTVPDPDHDGYVAVEIKPAANLGRLEEVLIVTEVSGHLPAIEQQDMAQSLEEADSKKRAADILSERLPSLKDPNAPPVDPTAAAGPEGDPGRPPKPGVALHPDRFSPATTAAASAMTPGETPRSAHTVYPAPAAPRPQTGPQAAPQAASRAATAGVTAAGTTAAGSMMPTKPRVVNPSIAGASVGARTPGQTSYPSVATPGASATAPGTTLPRKPRVMNADGTFASPSALPHTTLPNSTAKVPSTTARNPVVSGASATAPGTALPRKPRVMNADGTFASPSALPHTTPPNSTAKVPSTTAKSPAVSGASTTAPGTAIPRKPRVLNADGTFASPSAVPHTTPPNSPTKAPSASAKSPAVSGASTTAPGTAIPRKPRVMNADGTFASPSAVPHTTPPNSTAKVPSTTARNPAVSGASTSAPGTVLPRKPRVLNADGTVASPSAAPHATPPNSVKAAPATGRPPVTKPLKPPPSRDAVPPGGQP